MDTGYGKKGHTKNRHRMRCNSCRRNGMHGRFTLRRHPAKYVKHPKCPSCKSMQVVSVEKQRRKELENQNTCNCPMYPFPHRAGSLRFCEKHPLVVAGVEPTEEEHYEYDSCIQTPRGQWY